MRFVSWICAATCVADSLLAAELDRGHRLLLQYGFPLHAAPSPALAYRNPNGIDSTNLATLRNANFNGLNFEAMNWDQQMWTPPTDNYNWSRWDVTSISPTNPSQVGMIMASVWDEQDLSDPNVVNTMAQRLASIRASAPSVIGYVNDAGVTNSLASIQNYMSVAQPDMLSFDRYVFAFGDPWAGGSPTPLYSTMGKYRTAGLAGNSGDSSKPIPYGMWTQMFRLPGGATLSESEMAVQYGAAWAYGYTSLHAFRYSNEAASDPLQSVLFNGPNDTNPTAMYSRVAQLNQQTQNLAPALLRLQSTKLQFVRGQHKQLIFNVSNDLPEYANQWAADANVDPYLTGISVTNVGNINGNPKKNSGLRGDVIIGRFKPLMEEFDGESFSSQLYFLITNGLTDSVGNSADTRQLVHLNFSFGTSGITSLQRIDRTTGQVVNVPLVANGGSNYSLDWYLNGGEGDLFKYNTGAPFVGRNIGVWNVNASGAWSAVSNWTGNVPNGVDAAATLSSAIAARQTLFVNSPVTLGSLTFNNSSSYLIAGYGPMTMQTSAGNATVQVLQGTHEINVPLVIASNTTLQISAGAMLKVSDPVTIYAGRSLNVTGAGSVVYESTVTLLNNSQLMMAGSQQMASLTVGSGAVATVSTSGGANVVRANALSVSSAGGKLDLADNKMIITGDDAGSFSEGAYTGISGLVQSGRNGGNWDGAGIVTSELAAQLANQLTTIAVASNADLGKATFGGLPASSDDVLVMYTFTGDADLSGRIDADDYFQIDSNFGPMVAAGFHAGDFDYDGHVTADDYFLIDSAYEAQNSGFDLHSVSFGGVSIVPEPVSVAIIVVAAVGSVGGMRRRRR